MTSMKQDLPRALQPPRSPKGILTMTEVRKKKPHNRNALVHGFYSKDGLLPWDSKDDFEKLHQDLRAEFLPCGRAEEETVLDLAFVFLNKQTLWRMRQSAVLKDPFTSDIVQTEGESWHEVRKGLRAQARSARSLLGFAKDLVSTLRLELQGFQQQIQSTSDREEIKTLDEKMATCIRLLADHATPFLVLATQAPNAEKAFDSAYAPESMEKFVRLEAALDARIAKLLARLVGLKEFKRTPAGGGRALEARQQI